MRLADVEANTIGNTQRVTFPTQRNRRTNTNICAVSSSLRPGISGLLAFRDPEDD